MAQGTDVVRSEQPTHLDIEAFEKFRKMGTMAVAQRKEHNRLVQQLDGTVWGAGLVGPKKNALAAWCQIVKADPQRHVDMLGNKPYLNGDYWSDKMNADQFFHHYEQRDISRSVEAHLRERAAKTAEIAAQLEAGGDIQQAARRRAVALDLEDQADAIAQARAESGAPEWVVSVIETTIWRFINAAPIEAIRKGEITDIKQYLVPVVECNWAGGRVAGIKEKMKETGQTWQDVTKSMKPDPIGDAEPTKTAKTRSIRRCGVKAFSAWMTSYEAEVAKLESILEADFVIVEDTPQGGVQVGSGEPKAADGSQARALPGSSANVAQGTPVVEEAEVEEEEQEPSFDRADALKRLMATLNDAGVSTKKAERRAWAKKHEFPESTSDWTPDDFARAQSILVDPVRKAVEDGCAALGETVEDMSLRVLGQARPQYLKHWNALKVAVDARAEASEDEDEDGEL